MKTRKRRENIKDRVWREYKEMQFRAYRVKRAVKNYCKEVFTRDAVIALIIFIAVVVVIMIIAFWYISTNLDPVVATEGYEVIV